jgi:hypothetical protein
MLRLVILWIGILLASEVFCQISYSHYEVTSSGDKVGHLTASKKVSNDITVYGISSEVSIRVVFKIQMTNEIQAIFKNGILEYSSATLYMNDKVHSDTRIERKEGYYQIEKDGHQTKIYQDEIRSSSAKLYWQEPVGESVSLSETEGEMKDLDIEGYRKYALSADGSSRSVSTYYYSDTAGLSKIHVVRPFVPELHIFRVNGRSDQGIE